ncbi:uncharacterized protein LOC127244267 isoform X2 [Andrographis paniculata]|uniref:uncharacterized protein LOC127244267 isoform X2 n=1 Tax=Andrographis paniculata TaxID=175694 RepID=UPI0021E6FB5E|nr:uncharacterized protein LOC127244267 isoform X2 [Andrographis paniculata]
MAVDVAATSAQTKTQFASHVDSKAMQLQMKEFCNGIAEVKAVLSEIKAIRDEVTMYKAEISSWTPPSIGPSPEAQLAGRRGESAGTSSLELMTIGTRVRLLSRGLEKRVVNEGVMLSLPTPGDTLAIVKVYVTAVMVPETALILPTNIGAKILGDVLDGDNIEWIYQDLVRRPLLQPP